MSLGRRRGRSLAVAVAAVTGLVAACSADPVSAPPPEPVPATDHVVVDVPAPQTEGDNRAAAVAESARVLSSIPVPAGASRAKASPAKTLDHLGVYAGPVDRSLTRTRWWVVPMPYRQLVDWYAARTPADTESAYAGPDSSSPQPEGDLYWQVSARTGSYSEPAAVVSYARLGPRSTAIRTDATLAARFDRTAETLAPATVTAVDIIRTAIDGPDRDPTTATVSDPTLLARIVPGFNGLEGAVARTTAVGCGSPVGIVHVYALVLHWPGHTMTVDPGQPLCGIGMTLSLDGTELREKLEGDDAFDGVLEAAFDGS